MCPRLSVNGSSAERTASRTVASPALRIASCVGPGLAQWELLDDAIDEAIDALDERWYALNDVLEERLHTYARTQPKP
jgi:hypothetical protein